MIVVIFELEANPSEEAAYFTLAADLKSELETVDGFISVERFQSLAHPGRYLSLSTWRDEDAVKAWRTMQAHRTAQALGRSSVLSNYRLRVAEVVRDYTLTDRAEAPADSRKCHG